MGLEISPLASGREVSEDNFFLRAKVKISARRKSQEVIPGASALSLLPRDSTVFPALDKCCLPKPDFRCLEAVAIFSKARSDRESRVEISRNRNDQQSTPCLEMSSTQVIISIIDSCG